MKRIPLSQRLLPRYCAGEEMMNMITHIVGGAFALLALVMSLIKARSAGAVISVLVYGVSMLVLYTISSIYHGLKPVTAKKVFQILDHCAVHILVAGTYTPIMVLRFVPVYPAIGWGILLAQWGLCVLCIALLSIDLRRYRVISMLVYIVMGWCIIFFLPQAMEVLTYPGFMLILWGGISYTVGAILYGIGVKVPWMHSVFHLFVLAASILQFLGIYFYVL